MEIIGNLLGVPHADRGRCAAGRLRSWARWSRHSREQEDLGNRSVREFLDYLKVLVADRRRHPGDPEHDVLTRLIQGEATGEKLSKPSCCRTACSSSTPATRPPPT